MTLYKKIIGRTKTDVLIVLLEQLGAISRPYYLCQLRHEDINGMQVNPSMSFFLEELPNATEAIEATVSLARGLAANFIKTNDLKATREIGLGVALEMRNGIHSSPSHWTKVLGACISLEVREVGRFKPTIA